MKRIPRPHLHTCPVCIYPYLRRRPRNHTICASCGTHFDYDDAGQTHAELRAEWRAGGARFWSARPGRSHAIAGMAWFTVTHRRVGYLPRQVGR